MSAAGIASILMAPGDARRLEDGRGLGRRGDFRPWLTVEEVPSRGLSSREPGLITGRPHQLLSLLETQCFHLLDWSPRVVDIREQFPCLPLRNTVAIASALGFNHPRVPGTAFARVSTTDFVVTLRVDGLERDEAIACKYSGDLANGDELNKLELERRYWSALGISWRLVTERDIPDTIAANAKWVRGRVDPGLIALPNGYTAERLADDLLATLLAAPDVALNTACLAYDDRLGLRLGTALSLARFALATRRWDADRAIRWDPARPLPALRAGRPEWARSADGTPGRLVVNGSAA